MKRFLILALVVPAIAFVSLSNTSCRTTRVVEVQPLPPKPAPAPKPKPKPAPKPAPKPPGPAEFKVVNEYD